MSRDGVAVILLAAGRSQRMGGEDKLWADLDGGPLVAQSMRTLAGVPGVETLVVVVERAKHERVRALAAGLGVDVRVVGGGPRRQDSVAQGVAEALDAGWYLVHDAARPLVTRELAERVLRAARKHGAAVPAIPVTDTIKRVDDQELVSETVDRSTLRAVQTPQAFAGELLRRAHRGVTHEVTDDASMVERIGQRVAVVEGDPANMKVTRQGDLEVVRAVFAARRVGSLR